MQIDDIKQEAADQEKEYKKQMNLLSEDYSKIKSKTFLRKNSQKTKKQEFRAR